MAQRRPRGLEVIYGRSTQPFEKYSRQRLSTPKLRFGTGHHILVEFQSLSWGLEKKTVIQFHSPEIQEHSVLNRFGTTLVSIHLKHAHVVQ